MALVYPASTQGVGEPVGGTGAVADRAYGVACVMKRLPGSLPALLVLCALFSSPSALGQGNVLLSPELPAEPDPASAVPITRTGVVAVRPRPLTPEQSAQRRAIRPLPVGFARPAPVALQTGVTAPAADDPGEIPLEIAALARALRNDPDLIYQFVRDNIAVYPIWGVQKGALGALIDRQGTAFDQAALMVALLRAGGHEAGFVKGQVRLTAGQMAQWLGVNIHDVCAIADLLGAGGIPIASIDATAAGACPSLNATLVDIVIEHVWVRVRIAGTEFFFDPAFKPHARRTGIDLPAVTGYRRADLLAVARAGATTTGTAVSRPNREGLHASLNAYTGARSITCAQTNRPQALPMCWAVGPSSRTMAAGCANLRCPINGRPRS